jgi:hypothetical protein
MCQHCVTPLKLRASSFVDPDLADGPETGALLSLIIAKERQATLPYRIGTIGQLFSINGSRTKAIVASLASGRRRCCALAVHIGR